MVPVEAHLFLNHVPIVGLMLGLVFLIIGMRRFVGLHVPDRTAYPRRDRSDRGAGGCQRTRVREQAGGSRLARCTRRE